MTDGGRGTGSDSWVRPVGRGGASGPRRVVRGGTVLVTLVVILSLAARSYGQAASEAVTVAATAVVAGLTKLSLSTAAISFPDADPDTVPSIPAGGGPIAITAKARATPGAPITLTVEALDDLRSGTDVIPASALTWTATGPGFVDGTVVRGTAQTLASWTTSGVHTGTQAYWLRNLWTYATGTYTLTLVYTLTAP